jgi:hypothetical protein
MEDIGIDEIAGRGSDAGHSGEAIRMKQKLISIVSLSAAMLVAAAGPSFAHGSSAIQGLVVDSKQNRPLASASVSAFPAHGNQLLSVVHSASNGSFKISGLNAGDYRLFISKPGFRSVEVSGLSVAANDRMIIGFPIAMQTAPPGSTDTLQLIARCNSLVDPSETSDVYVVCGSL